jgi:Xaa-Pro aminopeptidase
MRHSPIDPALFTQNRQRLCGLLEANSLAVLNANDALPVNADATLPVLPNSDLFYLSGMEQEESVLVLAPNAFNESFREILFLREPNALLKTWEGHKHSKEEASRISGIKNVRWLSEFPNIFHQLMCETEHVYLNTNEHNRASVAVETRDARFIADCRRRYPLHDYRRLARLLHQLRVVKSKEEIALLRKAIEITDNAFQRVCRFVKPGVNEVEVEAEFVHEFTRSRASFAYSPIIASGANACILHYNQNDQPCRRDDLLLLDVAAQYANYSADLTRTIPVKGRFSRRQKQVYNAVLRVMRAGIAGAVVGKLHRDWQREAQALMNEELIELGLLAAKDLKKQTPEKPACFKYFMHGLGHPLGLDVHDVGYTQRPFAPGWVLTVEPGIYLPEEGFGIRLENNVLVTEAGPVDLTADIPVEADEIETLMATE